MQIEQSMKLTMTVLTKYLFEMLWGISGRGVCMCVCNRLQTAALLTCVFLDLATASKWYSVLY